MDRLGNSLDRALLLGALLEAAGRKIRLARATLPGSQAEALVGKVRSIPANWVQTVPGPTADQVKANSDTLAKAYELNATRLQDDYNRVALEGHAFYEEMRRRVPAQAQALASIVDKGAATDDPQGKSLAAIADHWWVQRLDGQQWVDMDPLLPDSQPAAAQAAASRTFSLSPLKGTASLPAEFCHEVTIRVVIEQWTSGVVKEKVPLKYSFRAADAVGRPMVLQNVPVALAKSAESEPGKDPLVDLGARLAAQSKWLPRLTVGEQVIGTTAFTDAGNLEDARDGGSSPGSSVGGGAAGLFGGLSGGTAAEPDARWIADSRVDRVPGPRPG